MEKGQAFSLVSWDSTYIWAVGRALDDSSNEQAFHHIKMAKEFFAYDSGLYKSVSSPATGKHVLLHSDK